MFCITKTTGKKKKDTETAAIILWHPTAKQKRVKEEATLLIIDINNCLDVQYANRAIMQRSNLLEVHRRQGDCAVCIKQNGPLHTRLISPNPES